MNNQNIIQTEKKPSKWIIFFMILSFAWLNLYTVLSSQIYDFSTYLGNVLDTSSLIFSISIFSIIFSAIFGWAMVELIFIVYRFILSFKVYSFVVPAYKLKDEMRTFFIYRNIFLGLFVNLCFLFPYLHSMISIFDMIITLVTFLCFAKHISKTYSEPLIGHFVFKCFINPIITYEILVVAINFLEVI